MPSRSRRQPVVQVAAVLSLACLGVAPAVAQGLKGTVDLSVRAGLGGHARLGGWTPVFCTVANQTPSDIRGDLVAIIKTRHDRNQRVVRAVSVPSPGKQAFTLYVPVEAYVDGITVELRRAGGDLVVSRDAKLLVGNEYELVLGTLSKRDIGLRAEDIIRRIGGYGAEVVRLKEAELPADANGLSGLDVLLVDGFGLPQLTASQREALWQWLLGGGCLVVATGKHWQLVRDGALADLLPVELTGSRSTFLSERTPWTTHDVPAASSGGIPIGALFGGATPLVIAEARLREGATPIAGLGPAPSDRPFVTGRSAGRGNVIWLAFALSEPQLQQSPELGRFYAHLASLSGPEWRRADPSRRPTLDPVADGTVRQAVLQTPSTRVPPLGWVGLFLLVYLLIAGPAEYFSLKRLRRLELTWITFPIIVAGFTYGAYRAAASLKGSVVFVNEIAILRQTGDHLRADSVFGLYSPRQQTYTISLGSPAATLLALSDPDAIEEGWPPGVPVPFAYPAPIVRGEFLRPVRPSVGSPPQGFGGVRVLYPWEGGAELTTAPDVPTIAQSPQDIALRDVGVNMWSMRTFKATWWQPGKITAELTAKGNDLTGTLRNDTGCALHDCYLLFRDRAYPLGALEPNRRVSVSLRKETSTSRNEFRQTKRRRELIGGLDDLEWQARESALGVVAFQTATGQGGRSLDAPPGPSYWGYGYYDFEYVLQRAGRLPEARRPLFLGWITDDLVPMAANGRSPVRRTVALVVAQGRETGPSQYEM